MVSKKGPMLNNRLEHYVDENISDMLTDRQLFNGTGQRFTDAGETGDLLRIM